MNQLQIFAPIITAGIVALGLMHFFLGSQQVLEINRLNSRVKELESALNQSSKATELSKKAVQKRDQTVKEFCKNYGN